MSPTRVWITIVVVYAAFFSWYTSFGGPLTASEIDRYLQFLAERDTDESLRLDAWRRFMESDTGDDFAMVNIMDLREEPLAGPGVEAGQTSAEVMSNYGSPFMRRAFLSAAHPVYMGSAATGSLDLWGIEGASEWDTGALVRYRSRRDLMEQALFTDDTGIHDLKIAALEKTIAFPVDPWVHLGDPRLLLALLLLNIGLGWHLRCALARA